MPKCYHPRLIDLIPPAAGGDSQGASALTVMEEDGSPTVEAVREIRVTNGALTDNGDGSVSLAMGSGGGKALAFFEVTGTLIAGTVPGPTNTSGATITISRVLIASDGQVSGSVTAGGSFSFSAGGGTDDNTGLSYAWTDGSQLSLTISTVGADPTWLTIDVCGTAAA